MSHVGTFARSHVRTFVRWPFFGGGAMCGRTALSRAGDAIADLKDGRGAFDALGAAPERSGRAGGAAGRAEAQQQQEGQHVGYHECVQVSAFYRVNVSRGRWGLAEYSRCD